MTEGERIERKLPTRTRRTFLRDAGIAIGAILGGLAVVEIVTRGREKAPDYKAPADKPPKYFTVTLEHGEEKFGHIREDPHMQGEIIGEVPMNLGLKVENALRVWGSETGASRGLTRFKDGQSRGYWYEGLWLSSEDTKKTIRGYVSSQFVSEEGEGYDKPKE